MYYIRVLDKTFNILPGEQHYEHFEAIEGVFYNQVDKRKVCSTNGFAIDIQRLQQPFRISRFVRDPRDLIISGYYYHKRGAEPWFRMKNPTEKYWQPINAKLPEGLSAGQSYAEYLNSVSLEEGLIAEMQWRAYQFDSIRQWQKHPDIKVFKYEDIIGNELQTFTTLFDFYQLSGWRKRLGLYWANKLKASKQKNNKHVRNPQPGQWAGVFTPDATQYFLQHYGDILDILEY